MNATGYALLTKKQQNLIYGSKSPYNNSEALARFTHLNSSIYHSKVYDDVHSLSELKSFKIRQKDIILSPISFTNIVLTPTIKNPIILSPIIFSSLVLSPIVLGPIILSPLLFVPIVLTPALCKFFLRFFY